RGTPEGKFRENVPGWSCCPSSRGQGLGFWPWFTHPGNLFLTVRNVIPRELLFLVAAAGVRKRSTPSRGTSACRGGHVNHAPRLFRGAHHHGAATARIRRPQLSDDAFGAATNQPHALPPLCTLCPGGPAGSHLAGQDHHRSTPVAVHRPA